MTPFDLPEFCVPEHLRDREFEHCNHWTVRHVDIPSGLATHCGPYVVQAVTLDGQRYTLACRYHDSSDDKTTKAPQWWYWPSNRLDEGLDGPPMRGEMVQFLLRCMAENGDKPARDVMRVYNGTWAEELLPGTNTGRP